MVIFKSTIVTKHAIPGSIAQKIHMINQCLAKMECNKSRNTSKCNCSYPCSRKGVCCDCLHYHRQMGELPACYFPDDFERSYDRSIESFISLYQKRGSWF